MISNRNNSARCNSCPLRPRRALRLILRSWNSVASLEDGRGGRKGALISPCFPCVLQSLVVEFLLPDPRPANLVLFQRTLYFSAFSASSAVTSSLPVNLYNKTGWNFLLGCNPGILAPQFHTFIATCFLFFSLRCCLSRIILRTRR